MGEVVKIKPRYQFGKTVLSSLKAGLISLGAIGLAAIIAALSDASALSIILGQAKVPAPLVAAIAVPLAGVIGGVVNYVKNKDK